MERRSFLQGVGVVAATSMVSGCATRPTLTRFVPMGKWESTLCQGCTSWCAVEAYVSQGRVVKVRGNAQSMGNHGHICPRPHLALQQQYDPDRIKRPMKRTNPKKGRGIDPQFVPISWDEALDTIADKILALRAKGTPERFALFRGRYSHLNEILYKVLPQLIGSPNSISHSSICAEGEKFASYYTEGDWDYSDFDLAHTRYILSWGVDPLASNRQVPHFIHIWGSVGDQAKVTVIDPRLSATAIKADRWLSVIPGEDGAMISAIAHTILVHGLWYRPFVGDFVDEQNRFKVGETVDAATFAEKETHGIVAWWNIELKDKTPQWASQRCGIDAATIEAVALEFAAAAPRAISWVATGVSMQIRGAYAAMGAHALNGLVGSIDNIGGVMQTQKVPLAPTPDYKPYMDAIAQKGVKFPVIDGRGSLDLPALKKKSGGGVVTNHVADAMLSNTPYPIEVAMGYWNNYAFSCSGATRWEEALSKLPFFVHISTNVAETTQFADIVLPAAHSMFEKFAFVANKQNLHSYVHIQKSVVKPMFEAKADETHIPFLLAQKLAQKGFDALWRYYTQNFKNPFTSEMPQTEEAFAQNALMHYTQNLYSGRDGFEALLAKGVWNSPRHPYRTRWGHFKTQTHRFEFYSQTLKAVLEEHAQKHSVSIDDVMEATHYMARGEAAFVPHYEPPVRYGDPKLFPLLFAEHRSRLNREARSANTPWYHAFKDVDPGDEAHEDVVKINPETARLYGIVNMQSVRIVSEAGAIVCKAKLFEGVRPGLLIKAYGQGHWAYGRHACSNFATASARGGSNNHLYVSDYERLSGSTARHGGFMRVRIEKEEA